MSASFNICCRATETYAPLTVIIQTIYYHLLRLEYSDPENPSGPSQAIKILSKSNEKNSLFVEAIHAVKQFIDML